MRGRFNWLVVALAAGVARLGSAAPMRGGAALLAAALLRPAAGASSEWVYVADDSDVHRCFVQDLQSGAGDACSSVRTSLLPTAMAVHGASETVYIASNAFDAVLSMSLDGSGVALELSDRATDQYTAMAVNADASVLYLADAIDARIHALSAGATAPLSGSDLPSDARAMTLSDDGAWLYWCELTRVRRLPVDESAAAETVHSSLTSVWGLGLFGGALWWPDADGLYADGERQLLSNATGEGGLVMLADPDAAVAVFVNAARDGLGVFDSATGDAVDGGGSLGLSGARHLGLYSPPAGISATTAALSVAEAGLAPAVGVALATAPQAAVTVALDWQGAAPLTTTPEAIVFEPADWQTTLSATVAVADTPEMEGERSALLSLLVSSGDADYDALELPPVNVTVADNQPTKLFWAHDDGLSRSNLDGTGVEQLRAGAALTAVAATSLFGVADDVLFWSDGDSIQRGFVNGSAVSTVVAAAGASVTALAASPLLERLFWSDDACECIQSVSLRDDDSVDTQTLADGVGSVVSLAADAASPTVVWADATGDAVYGVAANASGHAVSAPWTVAAIDGGGRARGVATDATRARTCWTDSTAEHIACAATNGTGVVVVVAADASSGARGLWFDEYRDAVRWADSDAETIEPVGAAAGGAGVSALTGAPALGFPRLSATCLNASVLEGGAAVLTAALDRRPVEAAFRVSPSGAAVAEPAELLFTADDWQTPRLVRVTSLADDVQVGTYAVEVELSATGAPAGVALQARVAFDVLDDDEAAVAVAADAAAVVEGGPCANVTAQLQTRPQGDSAVELALALLGDGAEQAFVRGAASVTVAAADWQTPAAFAVCAVDDLVAELDAAVSVAFNVSVAASADPFFAALAPQTLRLSVEDPDEPGVLVSATSVAAAEGGPAVSYGVRLASEPTAPVTVHVRGQPRAWLSAWPSNVTLAPSQLVFDAASWADEQSVAVAAAEPASARIVGDPGAVNVTHAVESADARYDGLAAAGVRATVADDDEPGLALSPLTAELAEGEGDVELTVQLQSRPLADVLVACALTATADDDARSYSLSPRNATVPAGAYPLPLTFSVGVRDDDVQRALADVEVACSTSSGGDAAVDGLATDAPAVVSVVSDDDVAGVASAPANGSLVRVTETSAVNVSITLTSTPTSAVELAAAAAAGDSVVALQVFGSDVVEIRGLDDLADTGGVNTSVRVTLASADPLYDGLWLEWPVAVADDDVAALELGPATQALFEDGDREGAVWVRMLTRPLAAVSLPLSISLVRTLTAGVSLPPSPPALSAAAVSFTPDDYEAVRWVNVSLLDDGVLTGNRTYAVGLDPAAYSAALAPLSVVVEVGDNDEPGLRVAVEGGRCTDGDVVTRNCSVAALEGTEVAVEVALAAEPAANVTVWLRSENASLARFSSLSTIVQQPAAEVSAVDATTVAIEFSSGAAVAALRAGSETSGLVHVASATPAGLQALLGDAVGGVAVDGLAWTLTGVADAGEWSVPTLERVDAALEFAPAQWAAAQTAALELVDDSHVRGAHWTSLSMLSVSADGSFDAGPARSPTVAVRVDEDDRAGVAFDAETVRLTEAGWAAARVRLLSVPRAAVSVAVGVPAGAVAVSGGAPVVVAPGDWAAGALFNWTAADDVFAQGDWLNVSLAVNVSSDDALFAAAEPPRLYMDVLDDDGAGADVPAEVELTEVTQASLLSGFVEGSYEVALSSKPSAPVTVAVAASLSRLAVEPDALVFWVDNWRVPQTVTCSAANDQEFADFAEQTATVEHAFSSLDETYAALAPAAVLVRWVDDELDYGCPVQHATCANGGACSAAGACVCDGAWGGGSCRARCDCEACEFERVRMLLAAGQSRVDLARRLAAALPAASEVVLPELGADGEAVVDVQPKGVGAWAQLDALCAAGELDDVGCQWVIETVLFDDEELFACFPSHLTTEEATILALGLAGLLLVAALVRCLVVRRRRAQVDPAFSGVLPLSAPGDMDAAKLPAPSEPMTLSIDELRAKAAQGRRWHQDSLPDLALETIRA